MRTLDYVRSARNAAVVAFAFSALPASGAAAQQQVPWVVVESHGDVAQQGADGVTQPITPGMTLAEGAPVRTGADGSLVIAHGNDRVAVSANSAFAIPHGVDPATGPSIVQTLGTLLFKVEHTPGRRFEVDTPYLAAVVKGTVFAVSIDGAAQMVHVAEGAVEVTAAASHDAVLVKPGQTVTLSSPSGTPSVIDRNAPDSRGERSDASHNDKRADATRAPASAAPRESSGGGTVRLTQTLGDAPLDVAALTNGLVKAGKDLSQVNGTLPLVDPAETAPGDGSPATSPSTVPSAAPTAAASTTLAPSNLSLGTPVAGPLALVGGLAGTLRNPSAAVAATTALLPGPNNPLLTGRKP